MSEGLTSNLWNAIELGQDVDDDDNRVQKPNVTTRDAFTDPLDVLSRLALGKVETLGGTRETVEHRKNLGVGLSGIDSAQD